MRLRDSLPKTPPLSHTSETFMSLLAELQSRGVTTEDLEKAASVRLFEKAAAAEGVNLDNLSEDSVISLFEQFVSLQHHSTKEASAMNDEVIDLFEKTAAAEGIDLDEMDDEDLAELYNHYVENVLPLQLEEDDSDEKIASAQEKLAEAEILGRHMARAYVDELEKVAAAPKAAPRAAPTTPADLYKSLRAAGKSKQEAFAEMKRLTAAPTEDPAVARSIAVKQARLKAAKKAKNPRGTNAPAPSMADRLRDTDVKGRSNAEGRLQTQLAGEEARVRAAREAMKKSVMDRYDSAAGTVGRFRNQLGAVLGGGTRASARLRGNLALGGAGLAAAGGAGLLGYNLMKKESSAYDYEYLVRSYEDELLQEAAFEEALGNLYDAGYDLDSLV